MKQVESSIRTLERIFSAAFNGSVAGGARRATLLRLGLATGIVIYALAFAAMLILWSSRAQTQQVDGRRILPPIVWFPTIKEAGPTDNDDSTGGGGGGNEIPSPASQGLPPQPSLQLPLFAATTEPQLNDPSLPMPETIRVDPRFNLRPDDLVPTGLPDGLEGPPADGPGSGKGIGNGEGGGVGKGRGVGYREGEGWNIGGPGTPNIGGIRGNVDSSERFDTRPIAINKPRPNYTEEARKQKVEGVVLARVLIGVDGLVKQVTIRRGLAAGLNEEAIKAVTQMRFRPAMKSGQQVPAWISIEVEFNLR